MKNFIAANSRRSLPHPWMRKYIGTSSSSQKMKNAMRSRERKMPMTAPSSIRNHAMYAFTRCSMYFSDASRPIGKITAVMTTMKRLMPSTPTM